MATTPVTIRGTLHPDGSLHLDEPITLPPGQVQVTLTPWPNLPADDPFWTFMQRLWAGQKARGHIPRTTQELETERQQTAQDWDQRLARIARIQDEAARLRSGESPR